MTFKKFLFIAIPLSLLISCKKDDPAPISGEINIEISSVGLTEIDIETITAIEGIERVSKGSIYIFDENMSLVKTKTIYPSNTNDTTNYTVGSLDRSTNYYVQVGIIDGLSNEILSNVISFSTNTLQVTGIYHNNVLEHDLDEGWGEWIGVLSGDSIFITGNYLDEFDSDCKLYIEGIPDIIQVLSKSENEIIAFIDSTINYKLDFDNFYKECAIYALENNHLAGKKVSIIVFPDKPVLRSYYVHSNSRVEITGGMGNDGLDSMCVNNIKCDEGFYSTYASRYYHQRYNQKFIIDPGLEAGTYTFIGYLNNYSDSIEVEIP